MCLESFKCSYGNMKLTGNYGNEKNGMFEPMSGKEDMEKKSAVSTQAFLERNKREWMVVTRMIDNFLCVFLAVLTVIVVLILGLFYKR